MSDVSAREEILALMYEKENKPGHVQHVSFLALRLFDDLTPVHQLGPRERLLLEAAAHLHDIGHGWDFLATGHHKESARLIREHPWKNFNPAEVEIIAQVSRYHRKAMPEMSHDEFRRLSDQDRRTVQVLAALLRLADSLDRTHERHVTGLKAEARSNQLIVRIEAHGFLIREVRAFYKKAELATLVFQRDIVLMIGDEVLKPVELPGI